MKMNRFNASRYNNVSLDAFYAGGIAVCPDYIPYRYSNTLLFGGEQSYFELAVSAAAAGFHSAMVQSDKKTQSEVEAYQAHILHDIFSEVIK